MQKKNPSLSKKPVSRKADLVHHEKLSVISSFSEKTTFGLTMGLVVLLAFVVFHKFILGQAYYLFKDIGSDTLNAFYPHFIHVSNYMKTEEFPSWSFAQGMGQNIQSISINDPFYFIIYWLFPTNIAYGIIWMELAKLFITAISIYFVFKYWGINPLIRLMATLLFTFSSFMIVGGGWYIFSTEVCFLTLMLLGFEQLWQKNSWFLFPVSIALIASNQPFNLFLYGLFLIIYSIFRFVATDQFKLNTVAIVAGKLLAQTILGVLISSFFFWSSLQQLLDSPRVGGSAGYFNKLMASPVFKPGDATHTMSAILRFFSSDILGNGSNYKGWNNYLEAPLFYIGILPLLLMPQIFLATTRRKAIFFGSLLAIFLAPVIFPYFRYAIWVFTGDYYRGFSFFVGLIFLFFSILVLQELLNKQRINLPLLIITAAFLLILLYFPYPNIKNLVDKDVQATARNFILLYTLIAGLSFIGSIKQYALIALLFLPVFELGIVNTTSLHQRSVVSRTELSQKTGYNDYALDAAKMINKEDPGFFRISKNYTSDPAIHSSFNDAKAQGFYSTMVYGSFNQKYYVKFMEETGVNKKGKETESRWVVGLMNRTLLQTWASTKYKILRGNITPPDTIGYIQMAEMDNIRIFKNNHFLPLGFTYKYYIPADSFAKLESIKQDILLLKAFVTDDIKNPKYASLQQFSFKDTVVRYGIKEYYDDIAILKKDTLAMTLFSQNRLKGTIELDSTKMLFFSIPYDKGWQATIDGKAVKPDICNIGFMGFIIEPGKHEVELFFIPPFFKLTLLLTLTGIFLYIGLAAFSIYLKKKRTTGSDISTNQTA